MLLNNNPIEAYHWQNGSTQPQFTIVNAGIYSLQIYNRWGQRVFTTNSKNEGWDGTLHGHAQPADTYTWVIRYKVLNNMHEICRKAPYC